ncbi:MAG: hypothetical protein L6V84_04635 [Oscillospiraceae bacterium]|nr:MAG: hypothetical protein L6V84_04635 [Oscillospiraceae bacterium]
MARSAGNQKPLRPPAPHKKTRLSTIRNHKKRKRGKKQTVEKEIQQKKGARAGKRKTKACSLKNQKNRGRKPGA